MQDETGNLSLLSPPAHRASPCPVGECWLASLLQRREVPAFHPSTSTSTSRHMSYPFLVNLDLRTLHQFSALSSTTCHLPGRVELRCHPGFQELMSGGPSLLFELTVLIVMSAQERSGPTELQWKPSTKVHLLARWLWKASQLQVLWVEGRKIGFKICCT